MAMGARVSEPAPRPIAAGTAPSGETWVWGPEDAPERLTGSALDFCLLVTQRVHRDDTDLEAVGEDANAWLDVAQAFAGPSGDGRAPRG